MYYMGRGKNAYMFLFSGFGIKREKRRGNVSLTLFRVGGGFLLSRLRSIIGVIRFNFSVRYG